MSEDELRILSDERAITRIITAVARAQDARDWNSYAACFAPTVSVHQPFAEDAAGVALSAHQWAERAAATLDGFDLTQHCLFNFVITVTGDVAGAEVDLIARHELHAADPDGVYTLGGRYSIGLRRMAEGWRIAGRRLAVRYETGNVALMGAARARVSARRPG